MDLLQYHQLDTGVLEVDIFILRPIYTGSGHRLAGNGEVYRSQVHKSLGTMCGIKTNQSDDHICT